MVNSGNDQQENLSIGQCSTMSLSSENYLAFEGRTLHDLSDCVRGNRAVPLRLAKRAASRIDRKVATLRDSFCHLDDESEVKKITFLPKFQLEEIKLGALLGQGSFSQVFEIESFDLNEKLQDSSSVTFNNVQRAHRYDLAYRLASKRPEKFVVKFLRPECLFDPVKFGHAASGLVCEAQLLSSFDHPNIVGIRGLCMANSASEAYATAKHNGYFFIMEQLQENLSDRIRTWKKQSKRPSFIKRVEQNRERQFFLQRLTIARDIASALEYIHEHRVVFRDLKPDNIGFDPKGNVKMFDFGLSVGLPSSSSDPSTPSFEEETFDLTGKVGTFRYMAPEVHRCEAYNCKADVYSFSLVLHELLALEQPYVDYSKNMHATLVVNEGERPPINETWPFIIQCILEEGWSDDVLERPTMKEMHSSVRQVVGVLESKICGRRSGSSSQNASPISSRSSLRGSRQGSFRSLLQLRDSSHSRGSSQNLAALGSLIKTDSQHSLVSLRTSVNRTNSFRQRDSLKSLETAQSIDTST